MKVYYKLHVTPTCFDQSYSHLQGGLLATSKYYNFFNQYTNVKYSMFHIFFIFCLYFISVYWFKHFCNISIYLSSVLHLTEDGRMNGRNM